MLIRHGLSPFFRFSALVSPQDLLLHLLFPRACWREWDCSGVRTRR